MPPARIALVCLSRHELRTIQQLPQLRQTLSAANSRASCFWSFTRVSKHPLQSIRLADKEIASDCTLAFSTSSYRRLEPKNERKQPPAPSAAEQQEDLSQSTSSRLATSLKSKLPSFRHENIYNLPNLLTFSRLLSTPFLGYLIIHNHHLYAFSLFAYAGISDLLDGWIARRWNLQTVVGSVVDPMADKALMTTLVTCLAINGSLNLPLATLILGRDVSLAIAAIYFRYASLPAPKTMARYWDFSLPSAEVHPTTVSKLNTFLQLGLIGTTLCVNLLHDPSATHSVAGGLLMSIQQSMGGPEGVDALVKGMSGVVAGTTIYSGLSYVWTSSAVKILGEDETLKKKQGLRGRMIIGGSFGSVIALAAWLYWMEYKKHEEADREEK